LFPSEYRPAHYSDIRVEQRSFGIGSGGLDRPQGGGKGMWISIKSIRKALLSAGAGLVLSGLLTGCMFGDKKPVATPPKQFGPGSAFPPQTQQPPLSQNKLNSGPATDGRFSGPGANTQVVGVPGSPMLQNPGSPIVNNTPQRQMQPNNPALNPLNPPAPLSINSTLNGESNLMIGSSESKENVIQTSGGPLPPIDQTPLNPQSNNISPPPPPSPIGQSIDSQSKSYQLPGTGLAPSPGFQQQSSGRNPPPPSPSSFPQEEPTPPPPLRISSPSELKLK